MEEVWGLEMDRKQRVGGQRNGETVVVEKMEEGGVIMDNRETQ